MLMLCSPAKRSKPCLRVLLIDTEKLPYNNFHTIPLVEPGSPHTAKELIYSTKTDREVRKAMLATRVLLNYIDNY